MHLKERSAMFTTRLARLVLCGGVIASAITLPAFPANAGSGVQVATAPAAIFAAGEVPLEPGATRAFSVTLTIPQGPVTATPSTGSVDLTRPWATMTEWDGSGTELCSTAANPTRYTAGGLSANHLTWRGTSVDLACNDRSGYTFYRVTWTPAPLSILVTNPVVVNWMGGQVNRWDAGALHGVVALSPEANQTSVMTVCGYRPTGRGACYGGTHFMGMVIPTTDGMRATAFAG
jgi:hypothetical protein